MRLDTEQFAVYQAMMDLIQNGDAIDGPGNNSYLHYDATTGIFTVVPWDMNLSFAGMMRGGSGPSFAGATRGRRRNGTRERERVDHRRDAGRWHGYAGTSSRRYPTDGRPGRGTPAEWAE